MVVGDKGNSTTNPGNIQACYKSDCVQVKMQYGYIFDFIRYDTFINDKFDGLFFFKYNILCDVILMFANVFIGYCNKYN